EDGLNNPQAFAGAQPQTTPAFILSFDTVADTVVEPPGTTLADTVDKTTEMDCGWLLSWEELPPHPELSRTRVNVANKKNDFPLIPFLKFIGPPISGAARFR